MAEEGNKRNVVVVERNNRNVVVVVVVVERKLQKCDGGGKTIESLSNEHFFTTEVSIP